MPAFNIKHKAYNVDDVIEATGFKPTKLGVLFYNDKDEIVATYRHWDVVRICPEKKLVNSTIAVKIPKADRKK